MSARPETPKSQNTRRPKKPVDTLVMTMQDSQARHGGGVVRVYCRAKDPLEPISWGM
jgi:hypothetical protein